MEKIMSSNIWVNIPFPFALEQNELALLSTNRLKLGSSAQLICPDRVQLPTGTRLSTKGETLFQAASLSWWPNDHGYSSKVFVLQALKACKIPAGELCLQSEKSAFSLAIITLSDSAVHGTREDHSGPALEKSIGQSLDLTFCSRYLLADSKTELKALLIHLALEQNVDLIITTGGTGIAPSDITPETTLEVLDKQLPGFEQIMMQTALNKTPHAIISRAVAGSLANTLIINLPGSPKAATENLSPIIPALEHALKKLQGDPTDCGQ